MGERLNNLIDSAKGELGKILMEEAGPAIAAEMVKGTTFEIISDAAGIVIPGVGNMMLSYKQKKLERNYELYIAQIVEKQDAINERLEKLEEEKKKEIQSNYFGLIADYASQEKQQEKMNYIVNGFINITGNVLSQEDTILMYYDTLEQLTILDLRVLRLYIASDEDVQTIMEDYKLDFSQLGMIKEKLSRLGLLESKNDLDMDENMRNVAQYLEDVTKGKKNPKLKRLKRISKFESYRLTSYGRKLYQFFSGIIDTE